MATVEIHITLKPSLLDVQGATTLKALHQLGYDAVSDVRIGKYIVLEVDGSDDEALQEQLDAMCQQLLANPVIENYDIAIDQAVEAVDGAAVNGYAATPVSTRAVAVPQHKSGTERVAATTVTHQTDAVRSLGGVRVVEPFAVDFLSYTAMSTEEQLALQELAWQKHEGWILHKLQENNSAWILCVGGDVIERGATIDTLPNEAKIDALGQENDLVPWVFTSRP